MTITTIYSWSAALLTLRATSCAPTYYTNLTPVRPTNLFVEGRAQARAATADSVEVRLSFVRYEGPRMVFEAVYRNLTTCPLLVAPTEFICQPRRRAAGPGRRSTKRPPRPSASRRRRPGECGRGGPRPGAGN